MKRSIKNPDHKKQVLIENYGSSTEELSLKEYVKIESENDPNFFMWLFDENEAWEDFQCPEEAQEAWEEFLNDLK